jgi:RimJ/RimL family protein N-acetyltransferase
MAMKIEHKNIIAAGERAILRDRELSDMETQLRWLSRGEWLQYDAPWEQIDLPATDEERANFREKFLIHCGTGQTTPRKKAIIAAPDGTALGWVNRYASERFPAVWNVGIDICEDSHLNRGIGTEALKLWIGYLFKHSSIHKIALATWSINPRMRHVAEKLGFRQEGVEREMIEWRGSRLDRILYGMLRREWDKNQEGAQDS